MALIISSATFAAGWIKTFETGSVSRWVNQDGTVYNAVSYAQVTELSDADWYYTAFTISNMLGATQHTAWNITNSSAYFNGGITTSGTQYAAGSEYSLVSAKFTPTAGVSTLYYEIQEIKAYDKTPTSEGEQIFLEVSTNDGATWTPGTENVLTQLDHFNVSTSSVKVLSADLSAYIGQDIRVRFRGVIDKGAFATSIFKVALVDATATDLAVTTATNLVPKIPIKQANQVLNASVANFSKATTADEATVSVTSEPASYNATLNVPALGTLESTTLSFKNATPFAPTTYGSYTLKYELSDTNDTNPANNTATSNSVTISPGVFAMKDFGSVFQGVGSPSNALGYKFTLTASDIIESVSVGWGTLQAGSLEFKVEIYKVNPENDAVESLVYTSEEFKRPNSSTVFTGKEVDFKEYRFATPPTLNSGTYVFAVKQVSTTGMLGIGASQESGTYYQVGMDSYDNYKTKATPTTAYNLYIRVNTKLDGLSFSPAEGATISSLTGPVIAVLSSAIPVPTPITFDESKPITINGNPITGTPIVIDLMGLRRVTIPHDAFTEKKITVHIPAGAIVGFERDINWSFYTNAPQTAIEPVATDAVFPADGATGIPITSPLSITFDKPVNTNGTPNLNEIYLYPVASGALTLNVVATIDAENPNKINIAHANLAAGAVYKVIIPAGTIQGYDTEYSWTFTTLATLARTAISPLANAVGVPLDAPLFIQYNRETIKFAGTDDLSKEVNITINTGSGAVPTPTILTIIGNRLTVPHANFTASTSYSIVIPANTLQDFAGSQTFSFTTGTGASAYQTINVIDKTPATGATVALTAPLSITFDKPVNTNGTPNNTAALTSAGFTIKASDGTSVSIAAAPFDAENPTTLNLTHSAAFKSNAQYTATLLAGGVQGIENDYSWTFNTEKTAIAIIDKSTQVAVDELIKITFDKAISVNGAPNLTNITIKDLVTNTNLSNIITGIVGPNGPNVTTGTIIVLAHTNEFAYNREYQVTIPVGSVAGYDEDIVWTFTTPKASIAVVDKTPENASTDLALNVPVSITFDKAVNINGAPDYTKISIFETDDPTAKADNVVASIDASDNTKINIAHGELRDYKDYTVKIPAGTIIGIDEEITWSFMTSPAVITVLEDKLTPADGATGVAINAAVKVIFDRLPGFNEEVKFNLITIKDASGTAVSGVSATSPMLSFDINIAHANFDYNTQYTVTIPKEAILGLSEEVSWSFTTEAVTLEVLDVAPLYGTAELDDVVSVTFDKTVDTNGTPSLSGIKIATIDGVEVGNIAASFEGSTINITHDDFNYATQYIVTIPATAVVGPVSQDGGVVENITWEFVTKNEPLAITGISPEGDDVALDAPIYVEFNRNPVPPRAPRADGDNVTITDAAGNEVTGVAGTLTDNKITITHDDFAFSTVYTVTIFAGKLISSTDYAEDITWSFTTIDGVGIKNVGTTAKVYPTVTKGNVTVNTDVNATVKILDFSGRTIDSYQSTGTLNINLGYTNGLYLVVIDDGKTISTHKVILQK